MENEMSVNDFFPRMEKWLTAYGLPADAILLCTQYVHTGDPVYLTDCEDGGNKTSGHDGTMT